MMPEKLITIIALCTLWLSSISLVQEIIQNKATTLSKMFALLTTILCVSTIVLI